MGRAARLSIFTETGHLRRLPGPLSGPARSSPDWVSRDPEANALGSWQPEPGPRALRRGPGRAGGFVLGGPLGAGLPLCPVHPVPGRPVCGELPAGLLLGQPPCVGTEQVMMGVTVPHPTQLHEAPTGRGGPSGPHGHPDDTAQHCPVRGSRHLLSWGLPQIPRPGKWGSVSFTDHLVWLSERATAVRKTGQAFGRRLLL